MQPSLPHVTEDLVFVRKAAAQAHSSPWTAPSCLCTQEAWALSPLLLPKPVCPLTLDSCSRTPPSCPPLHHQPFRLLLAPRALAPHARVLSSLCLKNKCLQTPITAPISCAVRQQNSDHGCLHSLLLLPSGVDCPIEQCSQAWAPPWPQSQRTFPSPSQQPSIISSVHRGCHVHEKFASFCWDPPDGGHSLSVHSLAEAAGCF